MGSDMPFPHFHISLRERALLPALTPPARAFPHSQSGPHAGMWFAAIPSDAVSALTPDLMMHVAMTRRLRLPLPSGRSPSRSPGTSGRAAAVAACRH